MFIAVSGSQGSGKSTILKELKQVRLTDPNDNYPQQVKVVERKTSRSILTDWNVTLQEVNDNHDLTIKFQDEILLRKYNDEAVAANSQELWFTERTYADLFTYALVSLGKDNTYSDWLDDYYKRCMRFQQQYDHVYYLKAGYFNVVGDGVRGAGKHYSRMVDLVMLDYTEQMTQGSKFDIIRTPDIDERVAIISTRSVYEWEKRQKR